MNIDFFKRLLAFAVLLLVQALVLNHIILFGCATPLLYVYFVISFRRGYPKWGMLLWAFLMGLALDMFSNTPGVAASTLTLLALVQPYYLELFLQRDADEDFRPAIFSMGLSRYSVFAFSLTFLYCLLYFTVETFTFFNWLQWLLSVVSSTLLTFVLLLVVDNFRKK
jgi:rod shape-determining protein MreD